MSPDDNETYHWLDVGKTAASEALKSQRRNERREKAQAIQERLAQWLATADQDPADMLRQTQEMIDIHRKLTRQRHFLFTFEDERPRTYKEWADYILRRLAEEVIFFIILVVFVYVVLGSSSRKT